MNNEWITTQTSFKYMLSDLMLFERKLVLKVQLFKGISEDNSPAVISNPGVSLTKQEHGYLMRSIPLPLVQPVYRSDKNYIYYIPDQFNRYYIDLQQSFEEYTAKFSSKTRSTIKRKIKKFSTQCDGKMRWKSYRSVDEFNEFYRHARQVSSKSYQEKLLCSGLPDTEQFQKSMLNLAQNDQARGYLLFVGEKPVAYMYCPITDNILLYQHLGYDPEYIKSSVGTILHWFAFEEIFNEGKFTYFDFTEGQSEHKRLYSTGSLACGNVYIFPKSVRSWFLARSHYTMNISSKTLGNLFDRIGLKAKLKKFIRFNGSRLQGNM